MKLHYIFALLCTAVFPLSLLAESNYFYFRTMTEYGDEMAFWRQYETDDYVYIDEFQTPQEGLTIYEDLNYSHLTCDTLFIPEQVTFEGRTYTVRGIRETALYSTNPHVRCVYIPKTLVEIPYLNAHKEIIAGMFGFGYAESYIVAEDNPVLTTMDKGILITKDGKTIVCYPPQRQGKTYYIPEGVEALHTFAFYNNPYLEYLEIPTTLKHVDFLGIAGMHKLEKLCFKDSLQTLMTSAVNIAPNLKTITVGKMPPLNSGRFFMVRNLEAFYCLDEVVQPINGKYNMSLEYGDCRLFVPRNSVEAYRADENWGTFKYILPIEPPVVAGLDHAEISWVNNFSATGYEWLLYTDAEQTQLYVTLYFDNKGNFLKMEFPVPSPNYAAAFSSPLLAAPAEPETREPAKEYYTYTLPEDLLEPGVQYYYECRAMKEEEIISTVEGAFAPPEVGTSLSSLQTGLQIGPNPAQTFVNLQLDNGSATIADEVFILSSTGSIVAHYTDYDMLMPLDIASLPAGQYFVLTRIADSRYTNQLIKQ